MNRRRPASCDTHNACKITLLTAHAIIGPPGLRPGYAAPHCINRKFSTTTPDQALQTSASSIVFSPKASCLFFTLQHELSRKLFCIRFPSYADLRMLSFCLQLPRDGMRSLEPLAVTQITQAPSCQEVQSKATGQCHISQFSLWLKYLWSPKSQDNRQVVIGVKV